VKRQLDAGAGGAAGGGGFPRSNSELDMQQAQQALRGFSEK